MSASALQPEWVQHHTPKRPYFWDVSGVREQTWEQPAEPITWVGPHTAEGSEEVYYHNPESEEKQWASVLNQRRVEALEMGAAPEPEPEPELEPELEPEPAHSEAIEEDAFDGLTRVTFTRAGSLGIVFRPNKDLDRYVVGRLKRGSQALKLGVLQEGLVLMSANGVQIRYSTTPQIADAIPIARPLALAFESPEAAEAASPSGDASAAMRSSMRPSRHDAILAAEEATGDGDDPFAAKPAKLKGWDSMDDAERGAVETLGWTASSWEEGDGGIFERTAWGGMSPQEQAGAALLGYDELDFSDELGGAGKLGKEKDWRQMSEAERVACAGLSWDETTWTSGDDAPYERSWEGMSDDEQAWAVVLGLDCYDFQPAELEPFATVEPESEVVRTGSQLLAFAEVCSDKLFAEMSDTERAAALCLGWTGASWEEGVDGPFERPWAELSEEEQHAAGVMGYEEVDFGEGNTEGFVGVTRSRSSSAVAPEVVALSPKSIADQIRERLKTNSSTPAAAADPPDDDESSAALDEVQEARRIRERMETTDPADSSPAKPLTRERSASTSDVTKGVAVYELLRQEARRVSRGRLDFTVPDPAGCLKIFESMTSARSSSASHITLPEFREGMGKHVPKLKNKKVISRAYKLADEGGSGKVPKEEFKHLLENAIFLDEMVSLHREMDTDGLDRVYKTDFVNKCKSVGSRGKSGPSAKGINQAFAAIQGADNDTDYIKTAEICSWAGARFHMQRVAAEAATPPTAAPTPAKVEPEELVLPEADGDAKLAPEPGEEPFAAVFEPAKPPAPLSILSRDDALRHLGALTGGAEWLDVRTLQWAQEHVIQETVQQRLGEIAAGKLLLKDGKVSIRQVVDNLADVFAANALAAAAAEVEAKEAETAVDPSQLGQALTLAAVAEKNDAMDAEKALLQDASILRQFYTTHPRGKEAASALNWETTGWGDADWVKKVSGMSRNFRKKACEKGSDVDYRDLMYARITSKWGVDPRSVAIGEDDEISPHSAGWGGAARWVSTGYTTAMDRRPSTSSAASSSYASVDESSVTENGDGSTRTGPLTWPTLGQILELSEREKMAERQAVPRDRGRTRSSSTLSATGPPPPLRAPPTRVALALTNREDEANALKEEMARKVAEETRYVLAAGPSSPPRDWIADPAIVAAPLAAAAPMVVPVTAADIAAGEIRIQSTESGEMTTAVVPAGTSVGECVSVPSPVAASAAGVVAAPAAAAAPTAVAVTAADIEAGEVRIQSTEGGEMTTAAVPAGAAVGQCISVPSPSPAPAPAPAPARGRELSEASSPTSALALLASAPAPAASRSAAGLSAAPAPSLSPLGVPVSPELAAAPLPPGLPVVMASPAPSPMPPATAAAATSPATEDGGFLSRMWCCVAPAPVQPMAFTMLEDEDDLELELPEGVPPPKQPQP